MSMISWPKMAFKIDCWLYHQNSGTNP
jgi:hypothetical protein